MIRALAILLVATTASADPATLVANARPALVATGITTRWLADSDTVRAHPTHLATGTVRIDTVCVRTFCTEELRIGHHVAASAKAALARMHRELADPGHWDDTDATEVVLPRPSKPGLLSFYRIESDTTQGAAHARDAITCETYTRSGRRVPGDSCDQD